MFNFKQVAGFTVITGLLSIGAIGCGDAPSYEGGCIISPTEGQLNLVQAYLDLNKAEAAPFVAKGKTLTPCYANHDPREYDSKKKRWDAARTDLNFPGAWANDVDAAIAGYAASGMPDGKGELTRVAKIVTLEVWNGRSTFPTKVPDQQREVENQQVELEGTPPANQNFNEGVVAE